MLSHTPGTFSQRHPESSGRESRRNPKSSVDDFHEVSLFAENQTFGLRAVEVFASLRIVLEASAVVFVGCKAIERDQTPRNVVGSFVRKEVTNEMPSAPWNDAAPILRILPKLVPREWVDLIADNAHECHWIVPYCCGGGIRTVIGGSRKVNAHDWLTLASTMVQRHS